MSKPSIPPPPPPPKDAFLTAEQILEFSKGRPGYESHPPADGGPSKCAYCGADTQMHAYKCLETGSEWPACCSRDECIDKWSPLPVDSPSK